MALGTTSGTTSEVGSGPRTSHDGADQWTLEGEGQKGYFNYAQLNTNADNFFDAQNFQFFTDINTDVDQNAHILGRWTRDFADDSQIQAFAYYDYNNLTTTGDSRISNVGKLDVEFQTPLPLGFGQ